MLPELNNIRKSSTEISVFRGLNRTLNTGFSRVSGKSSAFYTEFKDMKNMGADEFPQLATRKKRGRLARTGQSAITSNLLIIGRELVYVTADGKLHAGSREILLTGYTAGTHYITQYGNNVVVMPEKIKVTLGTPLSAESMDWRKVTTNATDNEWLYGLNGFSDMRSYLFAGAEIDNYCIEKVELKDDGKPRIVNAITRASNLEDTDMQARRPNGDSANAWRDTYGGDPNSEQENMWSCIGIDSTVEALGESPSGLYRCTDILDEKKTKSGYDTVHNVRVFTKVDNYYVKITRKKQGETVGAFAGLRAGDWVKISNMEASVQSGRPGAKTVTNWGNYVEVLNNHTFKVYYVDPDGDYIVIRANLEKSVPYNGNMTFERVMPPSDSGLMVEVGNRLWTCSSAANEIYACKQGDALNWQAYGDGISTDSYAVTVGCEGGFTGITRQNDCAIFFKENHILKLYGNKPSNFTLSTVDAPGVENGSAKSLVWIGGALYYLSPAGVCRYVPGGMPVVISVPAFDREKYKNAVAGRHKGKYVISAQNSSGTYEMFCYDTDSGMWHKEDDTRMMSCATYNDKLYFVDSGGALCCMDKDDNILTDETGYSAEGTFEWAFETGDLYSSSFEKKYISKIYLALSEGEDMTATVYLQFERGGHWVEARRMRYNRRMSFLIPIAVRRADYLKIRVEGTGQFALSALRIDYAGGSSKIWQY